MLATPDLIRESALRDRLDNLLPQWLDLPLYQARLAQAGVVSPGGRIAAAWKQVPFVTKREMRENFPGNFLRAGQALETLLENKEVELEHTSGTSEERVPVLLGRGWWDQQEERALRLNRVVARVLDEHPNARRAVLTTPACNGTVCPSKWLTRAQRTTGTALSVNQSCIPFLLEDDELERMARDIADWSPQFLDLDPVHGVWFGLYCERKGIRFPSPRFVLCSYEFVSVVHRRILQRAFGVPVFNLYGSTETGHLLMEDERGDMRPSYDNAFLEVVEPDERGVGDLVVTTLTNNYMPLLRYRIGDLVQRCEQPYATTYVVHGRARDTLRARDGQRVTTWQVDQCFTGIGGIAHYQLQQNAEGECLLRFVPDRVGPNVEEMKRLGERLETLLQPPNNIVTEAVNLLPRTPSGKFRLTYQNPQSARHWTTERKSRNRKEGVNLSLRIYTLFRLTITSSS